MASSLSASLFEINSSSASPLFDYEMIKEIKNYNFCLCIFGTFDLTFGIIVLLTRSLYHFN